MPIFNRIFNIYTAGKLFVLLIIISITSGTYALHYALYRRLTDSAVCFLFIFNGIFMYGFLNYLFSIGVALWATAGWVALRDQRWLLRTIYSAFAVSVLYLSHLVGVVLYALAILSYEIARLGETNRDRLTFVSDTAAALLPFLVVVPMALSILSTLATMICPARNGRTLYQVAWVILYRKKWAFRLRCDLFLLSCVVFRVPTL